MKKTLPLRLIKQWLSDSDCAVRAAAMNACTGRDIPLELIKQGLSDSDCAVRAAAMNACKSAGIEIPASRVIEPPENVYKKCVCGAIVVAHIPDDASTRGKMNGKCRASKAVITDIICDKYPEKIAVSIYDNSVTYIPGQIVEIENFDLSDSECSSGFHFFNTLEEAKNYNA